MAALPSHPEPDPLTAAAPPPLPEPRGAGVYVHVPFCRVRCPYCDFATRPWRPAEEPRLVDGLLAEAACAASAGLATGPDGRPWGSLFLGGGTPSRLEAAAAARLLEGLPARLVFHPQAEVTLEANPEDLDPARLAAWRSGGVTRLSVGVQSLWDDELRRLGRVHDVAAVGAGVARARAAGFDNLSLDLMYGFPGHSLERFTATLERALALSPEHVSAYAFTAEAGTPLGDAVRAGRIAAAPDDFEAACFERARDTLEAAGFRHYEISNFAQPGRETLHHLTYWRRGAYLGLGPAAVRFLDGRRSTAPRDLAAWAARVAATPPGALPAWDEVDEADRHAAFETVFLGLRLDVGLRMSDLPPRVAADERAAWRDAAAALEARGWLLRTAEGWRVPRAERLRTDAIALAWQEEVESRAAARPLRARSPWRGRLDSPARLQ